MREVLDRVGDDGLITRTVIPDTPPQVFYELTRVDATLSTEVSSLLRWSESHTECIAVARRDCDQSR